MSHSLNDDLRLLLGDISPFSRTTGRPLRPYQVECARAIATSVLRSEGKIFTVMFARQMGKNETSAQLEAYLMTLHILRGGTIVKAAPAFKPQIINSILRLRTTLGASPLTAGRWRSSFGYMIELGAARTTFLSAHTTANVVGATADLLLEIDEAQDVDPDKYDREFRPMASSTNATTVLYGTAWNDGSLLERQRRANREREHRTGERLNFEYTWETLAALLPPYGEFVRGEIDRLGVEHPSIQTQYQLRPIADAGRLFSAAQRAAMTGSHERRRSPADGEIIVAGIDLAGEDEQSERAQALGHMPRRDSTVVTVARLSRDPTGRPALEVLDHVWWTGREQVWQYERLLDLWSRWRFTRVCVDASGIGAGIADFLRSKHPDRVERVVFSAPAKSVLAYTMLEMANTGRLQIYANDGSPEWRECWTEIEACRYRLRANEQIAWEVPPNEGHDDFVDSLALCCKAGNEAASPAESGLLRAHGYEAGSEW